MNIWDSWARMHRNARALGAAFAMLIAIVAMQLLRCNPVVEHENISGVVLTLEAEGLHPFGDGKPYTRILVATPDSITVRLLLPSPVPKVGDVIPMVAEHYKKGDTLYSLDHQKWQMDGPR